VQMGYEKYRELLREASKLQRVITKSETMSKNFDGGITEHPITVYGYEIIVNYFGKKQKDELKLICKRRFFHNRRW